jgi:D-glycero-alpha-D-manno-heptose-7-phosphate kinase
MGIKQIQSIHSRAPTRIDLAGGTVDIWPLYLFLQNPVTLNLGIDLYAEATIELSPAAGPQTNQVTLRSEDQNTELSTSWESIKNGISPPPSLELHYKLLKYFFDRRTQTDSSKPFENFRLSTRARSPAGAGLGGSSTLSIAMIGALETWANPSRIESPIHPETEGESFIEIVRDVETTVIRVPAGLQDYYGAMYGGLQSLRWGAGVHQRQWLPQDLLPELEKRLLLFYSGQSRNSGINNWALFKGFIDQQEGVRTKFEKISAATHRLEAALLARDWNQVGQAIAEEWETRKTLAPGITTPEIDRAFAEAQKLTRVSGKVCGAGGGGCFFVYLPVDSEASRNDLRDKIQKIFLGQGMRPLSFHGVPHGLEVQVTCA